MASPRRWQKLHVALRNAEASVTAGQRQEKAKRERAHPDAAAQREPE